MATFRVTDFRQILKIWLTTVIHVNEKVFVKCVMSCMHARKARKLHNKPKNFEA